METKGYINLCGLNVSLSTIEVLKNNEQYSEQYQKTLEQLYTSIMTFKFSYDGKHLWVSYNMGAINVVDLEKNERTRYIANDIGNQKGVRTLNSIFSLSPHNNAILSISPDQRYVAFSYPNCFLPYDLPFQEGEFVHKVMPSQMDAGIGVTEIPFFAGFTHDGKYLVLAHYDGYIFIIEAATGKQLYKVTQPYITAISGVDHADGRLMVSVSGAQAYCLHLGEGGGVTYEEFFIPPCTLATQFITPEKVVFFHSRGAVVAMDNQMASVCVKFINESFESELVNIDKEDKEYEKEELDEAYQVGEEPAPHGLHAYFDDLHSEVYNGTVFRQANTWKAATINEEGCIHIYSIAETVKYENEYESGKPYCYRNIGVSPSYLIVANYSKDDLYDHQGYVLFSFQEDGLERIEKVDNKDLRFLCLREHENVLLEFDQKTGAFTKTDIASKQSTTLFTYSGPAIERMEYCDATDKLLFVEGSGLIYLIDLVAKKIQYSWELKAEEDDKQIVGAEPNTSRFVF